MLDKMHVSLRYCDGELVANRQISKYGEVRIAL